MVTKAEAYAELMRTQNLEGLKTQSDPSILNADFYKAVPEIAKYSSSEKPLKTRVITYSFTNQTNLTDKTSWEKTTIIIGHYYKGYQIFTTTVFLKENGSTKVQGFKLRWLWFLFVMFGIGRLGFNWGTQVIDFYALQAKVPLLNSEQDLFDYMKIYIYLPIGAVVYWLTRMGRNPKAKTAISPGMA